MAVVGAMACQFSKDCKYFAQITNEGTLKIWNTLTNTFEQEFTPDVQLTAPCTCLHFISSEATSKPGSPRKKKRKDSLNSSQASTTFIALGTSSGRLLVYSLIKGDLDYIIDSTTSQCINCLSSDKHDSVYSGSDGTVLVWNLQKRTIGSKWVAGNEKINSILKIPNSDTLLTASKSIKLWNLSSKEVIKTFTGHSSQVSLLHYICPKDASADAYFISGAKGDRLLNCWNLNENVDGKNSVASFLMEDIVNYLAVGSSNDGITSLAATVRSGVVHVYQHILNGKKSNKPVKPKTSIQVVSDSNEEVISPMYITAATYRDAEKLCICYGSAIVQTFEDITISSYKKLHCLLREDIHKRTNHKDGNVAKLRTPVVGNDVHYLTSHATAKRKNDGQQEVPMEQRLENLVVNEGDSKNKVPKANNVAQLLVQGLHSKDKNILRTVLLKKDEELIKNTIKRIPVSLIPDLVAEVTKLMEGKTLSRKIGLIWLRNLILIHSGILLSNPELPTFLGDVLTSIEATVALQSSRNKLMGRLELLVSQLNPVEKSQEEDQEVAVVFNDKVPNENDENIDMEIDVHSSSDNEWIEEESSEGENENEENEHESDESMSS